MDRNIVVTLERGLGYPNAEGEEGEWTVMRATEMSWRDEFVEIFNPNMTNAEAVTVRRDNIRGIVFLEGWHDE